MINTLKVITFVTCLLLSACTDSGSDSSDSGSESSLSLGETNYSATTNASGTIDLDLTVKSGDSAAQLSLTGAQFYQLKSITAPSGKKIDLSSGLTSYPVAAFQANPFVINLPLTRESLSVGTYKISVQTQDGRGRDVGGSQQLDVKTFFKQDTNTGGGVLKVNLILYGPLGDSEELRNGLEDALIDWRKIYDRAGISLDTKWYEFEGGATLPDPRAGHSVYETISKATRKHAVNVIFASNINGLSGGARYGITSRSPGPAFPSQRSAVAISILSIAGTDGRFDEDSTASVENHSDEVRLAAEVMAQLTAHYLGLDYIVQFTGDKVTFADNLADTASCLTTTDCRLNEDARSNLMFPVTLRKFIDREERNEPNEFYARDQLTAQQAEVLNSNILLD